MVNAASLGCGQWGGNLVKNRHELVSSHIYDSDPTRLREVQQIYEGVTVCDDYEQLLAERTVDAIVLTTPADQHAWMAESAILAGKDVFVEKPLTLRYRDGERLSVKPYATQDMTNTSFIRVSTTTGVCRKFSSRNLAYPRPTLTCRWAPAHTVSRSAEC